MPAPLDLPPGWSHLRIGQIAQVQAGSGTVRSPGPGTALHAQLTSANVSWAGLDLRMLAETVLTRHQATRHRLAPGDIVVTGKSGSPHLVGRPALWSGEVEDCCLNGSLIRVRPGRSVHPGYLHRVLYYDALRGAFAGQLKGTTSLKHLDTGTVRAWSVPVPPLPVQQRISAVVEGMLADINAGEAAQAAARSDLRVLWDSVLDAVADGTLDNRPPERASHYRIHEVASVIGGVQAPRTAEDGVRHTYLRVANIAPETVDLDKVKHLTIPKERVSFLRHHLLQKDDLLVVRQNGSPDRLGQAALWHGQLPDVLVQNHLARIRPHGIDPRYLELVWNAPSTLRPLRPLATSTTGSRTLRLDDIRAVQVRVPDAAAQAELVLAADRWKDHVDAVGALLDDASRAAAALRLSVLARAFSGRLAPGGTAADGDGQLCTMSTPGVPQPRPVVGHALGVSVDAGYEQQEFDF